MQLEWKHYDLDIFVSMPKPSGTVVLQKQSEVRGIRPSPDFGKIGKSSFSLLKILGNQHSAHHVGPPYQPVQPASPPKPMLAPRERHITWRSALQRLGQQGGDSS